MEDLSLSTKTLLYWELSRAFRGQAKLAKPPTTQSALRLCTDTERELNPARPLAKRVTALKFGIIEGRKRPKAKKTNNVQQLRVS